MGPLLDPKENYKKIGDFFPTYHRTKPLVCLIKPMAIDDDISVKSKVQTKPYKAKHVDETKK